ncbi:MAG: efflux transporter outer membrane subunit [Burkholderiales bacterium]|nr:efflux transporter outer membrane subunit [Burkholderiales bacterium]
MRKYAHFSTVVLVAVLIGACTSVGPNYERPALDVQAAYRNVGGTWKPAEPGDRLDRGTWWRIYDDPQLDALAARVSTGNQNIRVAEARYRQAQAIARAAQADRLPFVSAGASAGRSFTDNQAGGARGSYELGVDASWEPDLWGRVRRAIEAGEAQAQAAAADLESARLSATAALVQNYLALRVIDAQARLLDETVAAYARFLKLTQNRYNAGVVGKSDVVQAEAQLKSTQAQRVDLGVQRAQLEHAIAVLMGETPASLAINPAPMVAKLPQIPFGVPSELLQRRPDIASAERTVAAANARIGVAQSALYPSLNLTASTGLRAATVPTLLSAPTFFWALGASAAQVLFDAGARQATVDQARAAFEVEVGLYRQTVLTSFQEVEDNLAALNILAEEAKLQAEAVAAARQSVQLTENRYKAGTASFLDVINVQTILLANERTAVALLGRRLTASVQLVRALGGGWGS